MERLKIEQILMECALAFAKRSTCARVKAGAVIAVENHIVSTGYNGNAPGKEHCSDYFFYLWNHIKELQDLYPIYEEYLKSNTFKQSHRIWATSHELHAEMNAIIYAARKGIPIVGGDIYTTYSPCIFCTKAIIHAGLKKVFYHTLYDREEGGESIKILHDNNIICQQLKIKE